MAFLFRLLNPTSVRTTKLTRVLFVRHDAWDRIAASHPVDCALVMRNVRDRLAHSSDDMMVDEELKTVYKNLVVAVDSILESQASNKVGELCAASASGDVFAMRRILASGFNADSADYYGRTPLHAAAGARFFLSCIGGRARGRP